MNRACPEKADERALLVKDVFHRLLKVRSTFNLALERCSLKGWPDRTTEIRNATRLQELFHQRLSLRLKYLIRQGAPDDINWSDYTSTVQVHERLQGGWTRDEERALIGDGAYAQLQQDIAALLSMKDPEALDEPYKMAMRDSDFVSAAWEMDSAVRSLDQELSIE
jgi:hypothetical protein